MRHDRHQKFFFASLQSDFARMMLPADYVQSAQLGTLVFYSEGKLYLRSTAALKVARGLSSFRFRILYGFIILPRFIRDFFYDWIARNRLRWFGRKETCRLPEPHEIARFLDHKTPAELGLNPLKEGK